MIDASSFAVNLHNPLVTQKFWGRKGKKSANSAKIMDATATTLNLDTLLSEINFKFVIDCR